MRPLKALWEEELNLRLEENTWDLILPNTLIIHKF